MGVTFTPRASYKPLGRQPFRPGQWQGAKIGTKHTTYIQNNFFGSYSTGAYNYGNYNCNHDDGMSKGMKWMLGLGIGTTLLGGILKMFGVGGGDKTTEVSAQPPAAGTSEATGPSQPEAADETQEEEAPAGTNTDPKLDNTSAKQDILKVDKKEVKTTTTYPVQYGDTWANVIMAKYKDENGNPISFSDAKELWTQLKKECGVSSDADGMPANIELPNDFKQYKLDINGEVTKNDNFKTEDYKDYDGQAFQAKKTTNYTATGTINGQSIGTISGSGKEVTAQLKAKGYTAEQIKTAMENGEIKISKQKAEES